MCPAAQICVSSAAVAQTPTPCTTDAESSPLSVKYDNRSRFPSRPATWPCQAMAASASGRPAAMSDAFFTICGMVRNRNGTVAALAADIVTWLHLRRVSVTHVGIRASANSEMSSSYKPSSNDASASADAKEKETDSSFSLERALRSRNPLESGVERARDSAYSVASSSTFFAPFAAEARVTTVRRPRSCGFADAADAAAAAADKDEARGDGAASKCATCRLAAGGRRIEWCARRHRAAGGGLWCGGPWPVLTGGREPRAPACPAAFKAVTPQPCCSTPNGWWGCCCFA
mmetsp:Transcript_10067/g.42820  ORF Transcript_10067/g.42820 Transcript_10067/m.42820 type:complete len:289 (+) Transcript_10067:1001-1867(+)